MLAGLLVVAVCPGLSVDASATDSNTTNRPLAEMSVADELPFALVTCAINASGVVAVVWAEESAPATSMHAAAAHKMANRSLSMKIPIRQSVAHRGLSQN